MAILTISREYASGGGEIAEAVAEKLKYGLVSKESIAREIEEHGKQWLDWIGDLDEEPPGIWERFDKSYSAYMALVEHCLFRSAAKNNVVILGRGGNWLLKDIPYALRVRIVASVEDRARRLGEKLGIDAEAAKKQLKARDHERFIYYQRAFRRDWTNPDDYDMTVNTSLVGIDGAVDLILGKIPGKDRLATPENREILRKLEQVSRVKADVITRYSMYLSAFDVVHDGKSIVLSGVALLTPDHLQQMLELAKATAGDTPVRSEIVFGRARW